MLAKIVSGRNLSSQVGRAIFAINNFKELLAKREFYADRLQRNGTRLDVCGPTGHVAELQRMLEKCLGALRFVSNDRMRACSQFAVAA